MPRFPIVGRAFDPAAFADYAAHVPLESWRPDLVVLHNTAVPSLAQRPRGLTAANLQDLAHYYGEVQGWRGGPHLFVDQTSIWVLNPLDRRGVHSPSWNARGWGVEMLGDYDAEPFDAGDGLRVRRNAVAALAALFRRLGVPPDDAHFRLHREDPKTTHACPGANVRKESVRLEVQALLRLPPPPAGLPARVVVYRRGAGSTPAAVLDATLRDGAVLADARALGPATGLPSEEGLVPVRAFVGDRFNVSWNAATNRVYLAERE